MGKGKMGKVGGSKGRAASYVPLNVAHATREHKADAKRLREAMFAVEKATGVLASALDKLGFAAADAKLPLTNMTTSSCEAYDLLEVLESWSESDVMNLPNLRYYNMRHAKAQRLLAKALKDEIREDVRERAFARKGGR